MQNSPTHQVLLIEDEPDIANVLQLHIEELGASVTHRTDGVSGLAEALHRNWSLILLDLNLPGIDGRELCTQLRRLDKVVPVMMVTARNTEQDCIAGLDSGADYYITKPFSIKELVAQVRAVLRRTHCSPSLPAPADGSTWIENGDLSISPSQHQVMVKGIEISLTAKEFELLVFFANAPGKVFSRNELLEQVWGYTHSGYMHTVNSHINRLRAKIEPSPSSPTFIQTVWGVGYKFCKQS